MNKFVSEIFNKDQYTSWGSVFNRGFFKPYESINDFGLELAAPLCIPIVCLLAELCLAIQIAAHCLQALTHLLVLKQKGSSDDITYEPGEALENIEHICIATGMAFLFAAAFVILPVLGAISIFTRLLATGYEAYSPSEEQYEYDARAANFFS